MVENNPSDCRKQQSDVNQVESIEGRIRTIEWHHYKKVNAMIAYRD